MKKPEYGEIYLSNKALEEDHREFVIKSLRSGVVRIIYPDAQSEVEADKESQYPLQPEQIRDQQKGVYDWQDHEDEPVAPITAEQAPPPQRVRMASDNYAPGNILFLTADASMLRKHD